MNKISTKETFELLVKLGNYHSAALYYSKRAYDHQSDFNSILEKYDAPVTIYVTTSFPEGDTWAWWFEIWDHIEKNDHIKLNFNNIRLEWDTSTNKLKNKCYKYFNSLLIGLKKQEQIPVVTSRHAKTSSTHVKFCITIKAIMFFNKFIYVFCYFCNIHINIICWINLFY